MDIFGFGIIQRLQNPLSSTDESLLNTIGHINFGEKILGKRSAGNPHAAFDVAGAGNVTKGVGLRTVMKITENTPNSKEGAPVLDPTVNG